MRGFEGLTRNRVLMRESSQQLSAMQDEYSYHCISSCRNWVSPPNPPFLREEMKEENL